MLHQALYTVSFMPKKFIRLNPAFEFFARCMLVVGVTRNKPLKNCGTILRNFNFYNLQKFFFFFFTKQCNNKKPPSLVIDISRRQLVCDNVSIILFSSIGFFQVWLSDISRILDYFLFSMKDVILELSFWKCNSIKVLSRFRLQNRM